MSTMICIHQADLSSHNNDSKFHPRIGSLSADQLEAVCELWSEPDAEVGTWECTVGKFPSVKNGRHEISFVLSGRAEIKCDSNGQTVTVVAGDLLILPDGWSGQWDVRETLRKIYVNIPVSHVASLIT